jgi:hypothetical protein
MRCYLILDHQVTAVAATPKAIPDPAVLIQRAVELDQIRFPLPRLIAIWNSLPGAEPLKRFRDRPAAIKRLWAALEALPISSTTGDSKQARVIALLQQPTGATIDQLMTATGWQRHSVRGILSGTLRKKLGLAVVSAVDGDKRIYRIAA